MKRVGRRSPRKTRPEAVGSLVARVLGDLGRGETAAGMKVAGCWEAAVGPEIARQCRPIALRDGTLEVWVTSSVWCQQLQMQRPQLLERLREVLGDDAPSDLRFRVGYTGSPARAR